MTEDEMDYLMATIEGACRQYRTHRAMDRGEGFVDEFPPYNMDLSTPFSGHWLELRIKKPEHLFEVVRILARRKSPEGFHQVERKFGFWSNEEIGKMMCGGSTPVKPKKRRKKLG